MFSSKKVSHQTSACSINFAWKGSFFWKNLVLDGVGRSVASSARISWPLNRRHRFVDVNRTSQHSKNHRSLIMGDLRMPNAYRPSPITRSIWLFTVENRDSIFGKSHVDVNDWFDFHTVRFNDTLNELLDRFNLGIENFPCLIPMRFIYLMCS